MGVPIIDSHAHIDFPAFDPDREAILSRMATAGVSDVICIATDLAGYPRQRALAESAANIWFTTGIHPCYVTNATLTTSDPTANPTDSTNSDNPSTNLSNPTDPAKTIEATATQLRTNTTHPRCVAIGEAGLDYFRNAAHKQAQHAVFAMQLTLAKETNLPIIIHARDADTDMEAMLVKAISQGQGNLSGVMHCFSSGAQLAEKALEIGFYISFSGIVTFKGDKTKALRDIACSVPQDRLLIETDAPYLTPEPVRAIKRNEPAHVVHILTHLAELRGEAVDELAQATAANTRRLFWRMQAQPQPQPQPQPKNR